jgi:hypothetical protein
MTYFKDEPHRIFYAVFFVLIYLGALLQTVTPLGPSRMPAYVPEKVKINIGGSLKGRVEGYFGENFLHRGNSEEGWMTNHGLIVLNSLWPTDLKIDLSFQTFSYGGNRTLRVSVGKHVIEKFGLVERWQKRDPLELLLEPGETLLYFYTPEGTESASELGLGEDQKVSIALRNFRVEPAQADYSFKQKIRIVKQRIFSFINHINYVYTSVVAFLFLLVALALHALSALSGEQRG